MQNRTPLSVKAPEIAAQWCKKRNCGFTPDDFSKGSTVSAWWQCDEEPDHVWRQTINIRVGIKSGCPFCVGQKVSRENSLARKFPDIAKQWHKSLNDCKPIEVTAHSGQRVYWQCLKNKAHVWQAIINDRTTYELGCPHCRTDRTTGLTDYPGLLKYFDRRKNKGIDPLKMPVNSKAWFRCPVARDHVWYAGFWKTPGVKEYCPFCRGRFPSSTNNLTLNRKLLEEFHPKKNKGIDPKEVLLGGHKKWWWRCRICDHSWQTTIYLRIKKGYGCPACARCRLIPGM